MAVTDDVEKYYEAAQLAFARGEYEAALRELQHALIEAPRYAPLYELAAQAHFALAEFDRASAAAHEAMALSEQSDWGWLVENYERFYRGSAYVDQMNVLNEHLKAEPDDLDARFVRAYQFAFLGYADAAKKDLDKLLAEAPEDQLARALLVQLGGNPPPLPEAAEPSTLDPPPSREQFDDSVPFPLRKPV